MNLDVLRRQFPALSRRVGDRPAAYFDGPGGTQVPRVVVEAMADYLFLHNANTHWAFPTSEETDDLIAEARRAVADLLGASPGEVAFGANMTSLTFHVARALGRGLGPGDEVVITELDHHANADPWRALAVERGLTVQVARMVPETGQFDWDDLERRVTARTRVLAIGAASNALGTINDIPRASAIARNVGALLFVDAVHYAPHRRVDVRAWDCDFLACSAYKFYGPHVGILYGKADLLRSLDVPKLRPAPDEAPDRLETGTQNHEGIAGTAAAIAFLAGLAEAPGSDRRSALDSAFAGLQAREMALFGRLWAGLRAIGHVEVYGPPPLEPRTPTVSFVVRDVPPAEVARHLARLGLFASHGNFYAATAVERLGHGVDGLVRAGISCYTTEEEVDRLVLAVDRLPRVV